MKTDGLFSIKVVEVRFDHYNTKPIKLWWVCDVHHNAANHAKSCFDEFLEEAKDPSYQHIFLSGGDSLDTCSETERLAFRAIKLHDDTCGKIEEIVDRDTESYIEKIKPFMAGKTIGVIGGNHTWEFRAGDNVEQRIARGLKAPYLGDAAYIVLVLKYRNTSYSHEVKIFAHHESSDAKLKKLGARIDADIVFGAHTHNSFVDPIPKLKLIRNAGNCTLQHHVTRVVRGKSFLRSYVDGNRSYAVKAGYAPTEIGASSCVITPRRRRIGNKEEERWIDIKAVV